MTAWLQMLMNWFYSIWDNILDGATFDLFGFQTSFGSVIVAFILIAIVANVWWKGAHQ